MSYESIRLEKGMYRESGKSFSQVLESLDPSEAYQGTALEGTDAFQRQLKRFGIRARGIGSDRVEKFFSTFESAVLFPEFIARVVRQGIDEDRSIETTLDIAWQILEELDVDQLSKIDRKYIEKYLKKKE